MFLDLLLLQCILCFIIDISGAMRKFKKPFSCSLCSGFWVGNFYLIVTGQFTLLGVAYVAFLSMMTPVITGILLTFREICNWFLIKITPK